MSPLDLVAAVLATYRVARLVTREDGPADAFARLRTWRGWPPTVLDLLSCPLCASVWIAPVVVTATASDLGLFVVCALAASGGATALFLQERES